MKMKNSLLGQMIIMKVIIIIVATVAAIIYAETK